MAGLRANSAGPAGSDGVAGACRDRRPVDGAGLRDAVLASRRADVLGSRRGALRRDQPGDGRSGDWLAPYYNDEPFFDKPALFHILQGGAMSVVGATEFAARIVPALAALALIW